jgi:hypothetical protein
MTAPTPTPITLKLAALPLPVWQRLARQIVETVADQAIVTLSAALPRAQYARAVLRGHQAWSGADLQGKARRYSAGYATQRNRARYHLHLAGGSLAYDGNDHGRVIPVVWLDGPHDGPRWCLTWDGVAVQRGARVYLIEG